MDRSIAVVLEWHDALSAGDVDRLAVLTDAEVEVAGPRGVGRGVDLVRDWAVRSGIRLEPGRLFGAGEAVVVEQRATWQEGEGGPSGEPQMIASTFLLRDGRVARIERFGGLGAALDAVGLSEVDEIRSSAAPEAT